MTLAPLPILNTPFTPELAAPTPQLPAAARLLLSAHKHPPRKIILQYAAGAINRNHVPVPVFLLGILGIIVGASLLLLHFLTIHALTFEARSTTEIWYVLIRPDKSQVLLAIIGSTVGAWLAAGLILVSRRLINAAPNARRSAILYAWIAIFFALATFRLWTLSRIRDLGFPVSSLAIHFDPLSFFIVRLKLLLLQCFIPALLLLTMATKSAKRHLS